MGDERLDLFFALELGGNDFLDGVSEFIPEF